MNPPTGPELRAERVVPTPNMAGLIGKPRVGLTGQRERHVTESLLREAHRVVAQLEAALYVEPDPVLPPTRWERICRAWCTRRSCRVLEGPSFTVWDGRAL
jgi:hypothetical protein